MSDTSDPKRCPKCGLYQFPTEAPQGLCPKCVLARRPFLPKAAKAQPAPTRVTEIAAAFPQLEIIELIGQGGMGFVFKARQPKLERLVALKILPAGAGGGSDICGKILTRRPPAGTVESSKHRHYPRFWTSRRLLLFADGIRRWRQSTPGHARGPVHVGAGVGGGPQNSAKRCGFAHSRRNSASGHQTGEYFGGCRGPGEDCRFWHCANWWGMLSPRPALTGSGATLGTPHYSMGAGTTGKARREVDHRADIYSLGVVFYEMLTGLVPLGRFQPPSHKGRNGCAAWMKWCCTPWRRSRRGVTSMPAK